MNWIIVILIAIITTIIVFTICGAGGGLIVLVALNGFSESDALPFLILFVLMVIGANFALSTAASWIFIKARHAESVVRFWYVAGMNAGVNILTILIIFAVITLRNL